MTIISAGQSGVPLDVRGRSSPDWGEVAQMVIGPTSEDVDTWYRVATPFRQLGWISEAVSHGTDPTPFLDELERSEAYLRVRRSNSRIQSADDLWQHSQTLLRSEHDKLGVPDSEISSWRAGHPVLVAAYWRRDDAHRDWAAIEIRRS